LLHLYGNRLQSPRIFYIFFPKLIRTPGSKRRKLFSSDRVWWGVWRTRVLHYKHPLSS
jgi:hypothetical protein